MTRFIVLFFSFVFFACGGKETTKNPYYEPPFVSLTDSIKKDPENAGLFYKRGVLFYNNNYPDLASIDIRQAWTLDAQEQYALSLTTILKEKNIDSAILFLEEAAQKLRGSIALQIGLARGYQQKGLNDRANSITDKILAQYPSQIDALTLKSELAKSISDSSSIGYLEKAYSLVPSDPQVAYDLGYEYAELKITKVLSLTDSLIKAQAPNIEKAYYLKGLYYLNVGKTSEAIKHFDQAITINYNFKDPHIDKGRAFFFQKNYASASKTFEMALTIFPTEAEFYYWLGKVDEAEGKKAEARLNYKKAYELDKTMTEAKEGYDRL